MRGVVEYDKPHLSFAQQLELLKSRGLIVDDATAAEGVLQRLGYYRFAAYAYSFRTPLSDDAQRQTSVQYRGDQFVEGTRFEWIAELAAFDRRLRATVLEGLECFELALRVQVAYVLGRRSAFAHLERETLDPVRIGTDTASGVYGEWREKFDRARGAAVEDFITHYEQKYDGRLQIWVAIEVMDFGSLTRLLGFAPKADRREIGMSFGLGNPNIIESASKTFNYLRNVSAHHGRLWNRTLTYQIPRIPEDLAPALSHFADIPPTQQKKVYRPLTVLAYATQRIPGVSNAVTIELRDLVEQFPKNGGLSPELHMGFVAGWRDLNVWQGTES